MDYDLSNHFADYITLLDVIDKTGMQTEGEFAGKMRDPEINAIACQKIEGVRQKIKAYVEENQQ